MEIERRDGGTERRVLIGCVTDSKFLRQVVGRVGDKPFNSDWSNLIYSWCSDFCLEYGRAPEHELVAVFEAWAGAGQDKETQSLVDRFLRSLSDQDRSTPDISTEHLVDLAEKHFNDVRTKALEEELRTLRQRGLGDQAVKAASYYRPVSLKRVGPINLVEDRVFTHEALETRQNVLVRYAGDAGKFFGDVFSDDAFIGVMAQSKGGKSYLLLDIAWRAMRQGRQVAYFQVGDLSRGQIARRFLRRAANRPIKAGRMLVPTSMGLVENSGGYGAVPELEYDEKFYETDLTRKGADLAWNRVMEKTDGRIHLFHHPVKTVSAMDIRNTLEQMDADGLRCDVVVIDYAGNLAPLDKRMTTVDSVSESWWVMRQISEVRKCLVVTAQQSNKEGFKSWVLKRENFSESKMILAHVTDFIGINMTDAEKEAGVIRYNFVVRREEKFTATHCLYTASCLEAANPVVLSKLP